MFTKKDSDTIMSLVTDQQTFESVITIVVMAMEGIKLRYSSPDPFQILEPGSDEELEVRHENSLLEKVVRNRSEFWFSSREMKVTDTDRFCLLSLIRKETAGSLEKVVRMAMNSILSRLPQGGWGTADDVCELELLDEVLGKTREY
jgi:hypothetical protein